MPVWHIFMCTLAGLSIWQSSCLYGKSMMRTQTGLTWENVHCNPIVQLLPMSCMTLSGVHTIRHLVALNIALKQSLSTVSRVNTSNSLSLDHFFSLIKKYRQGCHYFFVYLQNIYTFILCTDMYMMVVMRRSCYMVILHHHQKIAHLSPLLKVYFFLLVAYHRYYIMSHTWGCGSYRAKNVKCLVSPILS